MKEDNKKRLQGFIAGVAATAILIGSGFISTGFNKKSSYTKKQAMHDTIKVRKGAIHAAVDKQKLLDKENVRKQKALDQKNLQNVRDINKKNLMALRGY